MGGGLGMVCRRDSMARQYRSRDQLRGNSWAIMKIIDDKRSLLTLLSLFISVMHCNRSGTLTSILIHIV